MAYNDKKIKVDSSEKKINKKVKNEIEDTKSKIYWYLKFSQPLDETSVSNKTMCVTKTDGYVFDANIIYNKKLELIVIETLENYKEDEYYILQISKDVKNEEKITLKKQINILFKVKGGEISELRELPDNVKVKPPKYRKASKTKLYTFQRASEENTPLDLDINKMPFISIKLNPIPMIIGLVIFVIGYVPDNNIIILIGITVAVLGLIYLIFQAKKDEFKSNFFYNLAVMNINREKYKKANKHLKKAISHNSQNEYAEYAINKISFLL